MSLKKYDELTKEQRAKVQVMYSDLTTLVQHLYNFDDNGDYKGRQYVPPSGKDEKVGIFGTIHAQSVGLDKRPDPIENPDVIEKSYNPKTRTTKKK